MALAHPRSSDVFPRSADTDGAGALTQEESKKIKYSSETKVGGTSVKMIHLVMEHFSRWDSDGLKYLQHLSKSSVDELGKPNPSEFLDHWRKIFSVQLQKCNSNTIIKKVSSLSNEDESLSKVDPGFCPRWSVVVGPDHHLPDADHHGTDADHHVQFDVFQIF